MRVKSNLRCNLCSYVAPQSSVLQIHVRQHVGEKPFQCSQCSSLFVSNGALTSHIRRKHVRDRPFPCSYFGCKKRFKTKAELAAHAERVHQRLAPFKCSECSKIFYSSSGLNDHFVRIHTQDNKLFECNQCEHKASTASDLKRHTEQRHTTYQNMMCDICGSRHKNRQALHSHVHLLHRKPKSLFKCKEPNCSKEFISSGTLHYHKVKEHRGGVKPFSCSICPYSAIDPNSLTVHMRVHTGERPYKCDECEKCFVTSGHRRSHKISVHSDLRPFKCKCCQYKGKTRYVLKQHERTHYPDAFKQLECSICEYKCRDKWRLQEHHMTHQEKKPFNCEQCNYRSKTKRHLREHQKIHSASSAQKPFKCPECNFRCRHKWQLPDHMVIHSDLKPFVCLEVSCQSIFKRKMQLKLHLKFVHKKENKFKCTFCPEVFYQEEDFQGHNQDHIRKEHKRDTIEPEKAILTQLVGPSTELAIRPCFVLLKRLNVILL